MTQDLKQVRLNDLLKKKAQAELEIKQIETDMEVVEKLSQCTECEVFTSSLTTTETGKKCRGCCGWGCYCGSDYSAIIGVCVFARKKDCKGDSKELIKYCNAQCSALRQHWVGRENYTHVHSDIYRRIDYPRSGL